MYCGAAITNSNNSVAANFVVVSTGATTFGGVITAATPANLALTKTGTGVQPLANTNYYTGATTITNGSESYPADLVQRLCERGAGRQDPAIGELHVL